MDEYGMFKDIPIIEVFVDISIFLSTPGWLSVQKARVFWLRQPEFFASTLRFLFDAISFLHKDINHRTINHTNSLNNSAITWDTCPVFMFLLLVGYNLSFHVLSTMLYHDSSPLNMSQP